ncbi:ABC transporter permease [Caldimonas caldifontis]|uniref:Transport permease protein n=1 Tax=Caldimonas caldifontis TaxID=1452508 RepID=A0A2S5SRL1_9BURK|nr:ABC transporter permease [Caldimonas caldifontis]PPE65339.1 nodulation protein NodJ [Caldimonas caldifontis]
MTVSFYAPPQLSRRVWPVVQRNLLVWRKLALPSLLGNIAEPLIVLVAFGYGLGSLVGEVQGLPYIVFLASGSICMSTMYAASFESLYSAFSRMHVQKTWDGIMNAPVSLDDILFAEMLWAALKALFSAVAIVGVLIVLGISRQPTLLLALPLLFVVGVTFASVALVFNALARNYDFFTYYFTLVLTPMTFLSGVYFPLEQLPDALRLVAQALPLTAAVEIVRPLVVGQWPVEWLRPLLVLSLYAVGGYYVALALTRRRFFRS